MTNTQDPFASAPTTNPNALPLGALSKDDLKELRIIKQALIKSFVEAGVMKKRTPENEKIIEDWIEYIKI